MEQNLIIDTNNICQAGLNSWVYFAICGAVLMFIILTIVTHINKKRKINEIIENFAKGNVSKYKCKVKSYSATTQCADTDMNYITTFSYTNGERKRLYDSRWDGILVSEKKIENRSEVAELEVLFESEDGVLIPVNKRVNLRHLYKFGPDSPVKKFVSTFKMDCNNVFNVMTKAGENEIIFLNWLGDYAIQFRKIFGTDVFKKNGDR